MTKQNLIHVKIEPNELLKLQKTNSFYRGQFNKNFTDN